MHREFRAQACVVSTRSPSSWPTFRLDGVPSWPLYLTSVGWLQFDIIFHRLAILLGGSKAAWAIACVIQAALFGAIHAYQNPIGMLLTGTIGLISGIVFLAIGRNLWVPIIAHTLYDSARVVTFYLYGPPPR